MTGKFLDFSGPREVCPFPGDDFPLLMDVRIKATEQQREMASNFITDFILDKVKALEVDIQVLLRHFLTYDVIRRFCLELSYDVNFEPFTPLPS